MRSKVLETQLIPPARSQGAARLERSLTVTSISPDDCGTLVGTISGRLIRQFEGLLRVGERLRHVSWTPSGADCVHLPANAPDRTTEGDRVNLLFLTIELERTERVDDLAGWRSPQPHPLRDLLSGRILATVAMAVCALVAAFAGLSVGGLGGGLTGELPDWLPMGMGGSERVSETVRLTVTSTQANATVLLDGHERGKTPLSLGVAKGRHTLALTHATAVDEQRQLDISGDMHANVSMLELRPEAVQLKPAYPGASINAATFLNDGRLALAMGLPGQSGDVNTSDGSVLNEAWIFDPATGSLGPFMTPSSNPHAAIVAVSPDGSRVAYAQPLQTAARARKQLVEVAVADSGGATHGRVFALPPPSSASGNAAPSNGEIEEIHDITWSPDSRHLLVVVRLVGVAGGPPPASRSRVLLIDAVPSDDQPRQPVELLTLPAEIVAGSYNWAPTGHWVAFLARAATGNGSAAFTALCALDINAAGDVSGFRYVADLGKQADSAGMLPVADVAWSPVGNGQLLFTAPTPRFTVSNPLGLPTTSGGAPGLFSAMPTAPALTAEEGQRFGSATGLFGPTWIPTDDAGSQRLIAVSRSNNGDKPLAIAGIDPVRGSPQNLGIVLPTGVGGATTAAARWDIRHGRLLILAPRGGSNTLDYWVVQVQAQRGQS
jgi:hypothetical protein